MSESHSVVSNSLGPYVLYSPWNSPGQNTGAGRLSLLQARILEWVDFPFSRLRNLPNLGIEPRSPASRDSLPAEPQGKPKNTGLGSLSLLQGNFPTQALNRGLLHCRQILYQLSYDVHKSNQLSRWETG